MCTATELILAGHLPQRRRKAIQSSRTIRRLQGTRDPRSLKARTSNRLGSSLIPPTITHSKSIHITHRKATVILSLTTKTSGKPTTSSKATAIRQATISTRAGRLTNKAGRVSLLRLRLIHRVRHPGRGSHQMFSRKISNDVNQSPLSRQFLAMLARSMAWASLCRLNRHLGMMETSKTTMTASATFSGIQKKSIRISAWENSSGFPHSLQSIHCPQP